MLTSRQFGTPENGINRIFHYDPETDTATIESRQVVTGLVGTNKAIYNKFDERSRWKDGVGDRVASIPMTVYADLQVKGIIDDQKKLKAWLNDPDNRFFRTRPGTI